MKRINVIALLISLIGLLFIIGCYSSATTSSNDYTFLYDESQKLISPKVKIFHHKKDSSKVFFQIKPSDLLYGRMKADSTLTSRVLMRYSVYEDRQKGSLIDSATFAFIDYNSEHANITLEASTSILLPFGKTYKLQLLFRDIYKDLNVAYNYRIDKTANGNASYYLIKQENKIQYQELIGSHKNITILKSPLIEETKFRFDTLSYRFKMAPPPFITNAPPPNINFNSNSVVEIEDSITLDYFQNINRLIPLDSSLRRLYFYNYYEGFPLVYKVELMADPIRYVSTTSEYKKIKEAINPKKEIDKFWMKLGKDPLKAKVMIKEFYSRVELANEHFSTYREGWKSDRGIIYVVYGKPSTVYKTLSSEIWIYGEENNILSVKFIFNKIEAEESENFYILERNSDFKNNWYRAVDDWRKGRINS